jgi:hypothetical protein
MSFDSGWGFGPWCSYPWAEESFSPPIVPPTPPSGVSCMVPGWGLSPWGVGPWAGEAFTHGGTLPNLPPFDIYCIGPCAPMANILGFASVGSFGGSNLTIDPITEDLIIVSGGGPDSPGWGMGPYGMYPWAGGTYPFANDSGITISSTVPSMWTLDFTVDFLSLPVDFSTIATNHVFIGQQAPSGGSVAGLLFSQAGIMYTPCAHISAGSLIVESGSQQFLPSSNFLVSEGEYWTIQIAVSPVSNNCYIYVTKTVDLETLGPQLRYIVARTSAGSCATPPGSETLIAVRGTTGSFSAISLNSICLGTGLIVPNTCQPLETITTQVLGSWGSEMWGGDVWGGAGTYTFAVDGGGFPTIEEIIPNVGTTLGGTSFVITGENLATFFFNDNFNEGLLNTVLWSPLGPLPPVVGPLGPLGTLQVQTTSTPGSYGGVQAVALEPQGDFHVQVDFTVLNQFLLTQPPSEVTLAAIDAATDAGNYARISFIVKGPSATNGIIRCEVWKFGTQVHLFETPFSNNFGTLGLMRYFDPIVGSNHAAFWLNGAKIFDVYDMTSCQVTLRLMTWNEHAPYNIQTQFDNFISHSVVVFVGNAGCDVATNVIEVTNNRIRGTSPATVGQWAGPTDIRVTSGVGTCCTADCIGCWTYEFPAAFVVGRSQPFRPTNREASFTNDPQLRNPGLNIGLGLRRQ